MLLLIYYSLKSITKLSKIKNSHYLITILKPLMHEKKIYKHTFINFIFYNFGLNYSRKIEVFLHFDFVSKLTYTLIFEIVSLLIMNICQLLSRKIKKKNAFTICLLIIPMFFIWLGKKIYFNFQFSTIFIPLCAFRPKK